MPWSGGGVFTRLYSWVSDRDAGLDILSSRMDQDTDDIAQGLMHCLTVNGETQPLANLDMNNFRITGAAAGVNSGDYATVGQVLNGGGGLPSGGFLPLTGGTLTGPLQVGATGGAPEPLILATANLQLARADQAYAYVLRSNPSGPRNLALAGLPIGPSGTPPGTIDNILLDAALVTITGAAGGGLNVAGGNLGITGDINVHTINASGGIIVSAGGLDVAGGGFFVNGNAQIVGALAANNSLTVAGGLNVASGGLFVTGSVNIVEPSTAATSFSTALGVPHFYAIPGQGDALIVTGGELHVDGNLTVTGTINGHPALALTARAARLEEMPPGARLLYVVD